MKRKIAAILAADIAGYSRLVAEDEEETLRRLATCRAVFADFVERASGRIFNTAGDAILADFPSAVEAVRSAGALSMAPLGVGGHVRGTGDRSLPRGADLAGPVFKVHACRGPISTTNFSGDAPADPAAGDW